MSDNFSLRRLEQLLWLNGLFESFSICSSHSSFDSPSPFFSTNLFEISILPLYISPFLSNSTNMAQNSSVYGLFALLILSIACFGIATSASVLSRNSAETDKRLRGMFEKSQAEAINDFYEQKALKMMSNPIDAHDSEPNLIKFIPVSMLDSLNKTGADPIKGDQVSAKYLIVKNIESSVKKGTSAKDQANDGDDGQDLIEEKINQADQHTKNGPRQTSFFGGQPGFGNAFTSSNPIMGGLLRPQTFPTFPAFPTLGPFTTRPPRPKTSIIGNSGGAMALTNDNVVVVNVLSGNY